MDSTATQTSTRREDCSVILNLQFFLFTYSDKNSFNYLPSDKILLQSNLKVLADSKINMAQKMQEE